MISRWGATSGTIGDDRKQQIEKVDHKVAGELALVVENYINRQMLGYNQDQNHQMRHRVAQVFELMAGNQDQNHRLDDMFGSTSEFHADSLVYFIGLRGTRRLGITGVGELEISAGDVVVLSANLWHFGRIDQEQESLIQFGYLDRVVERKLQSGADSGPTNSISEV